MKKSGVKTVVESPKKKAWDARVVQLGWFWYVIEGDRCLASGMTKAIAMKRAGIS